MISLASVWKNHLVPRLPAYAQAKIAGWEADPVRGRLLKAALWSLLGTLVVRLAGFCSQILVARLLGKEGLGQFGMIQQTVALFAGFGGFALGLTATKYVAEYRDKDKEKAGRIIALSVLVALGVGVCTTVAMFVSGPWLAARTLAAPELAVILQISTFSLALHAVIGALNGILGGFEAFKVIAARSSIAAVITFPMILSGAYFDGVRGTVVAQVAAAVVNLVLNFIPVRRLMRAYSIPWRWKECSREKEVLWRFSLPSTISGLMYAPVVWASQALLANQPSGYEQLGIYTASFAFQGALLTVSNAVSAPLLPMLVSQSGKANAGLERINMLLNWILGIVPALPLFCFPEIVEVLYGAKFKGTGLQTSFLFVLFSTSILLYKQGLARVLQVQDLMWWGFASNLMWAVILLLSAWQLVHLGAVGLAAAGAIAYALNTIVFVPFYTSRGLAPRDTIISLEAGLIWLAVGVLAGLNFAGCSLVVRAAALPVSCTIVIAAFHRLSRQVTVVAGER